MKRTLLITAAIVTAATAATVRLPDQPPPPEPAIEALPRTSTLPEANVRVRHEFVTIAAAPARRLAEIRSAPPPPSLQRRPAGEPLLSKARRALLGDGRHRPEPFPRIK